MSIPPSETPAVHDDDRRRQFARDVVRTLRGAGYEALWAGGCVRDWLMGLAPEDYDVATSARPDEVRALFGKRRTLAIGASFGVIQVRGPREAGEIEVATFRTEGPYLDGRHPQSVQFATPQEDALRRDFTINGMFYDPLNDTVLDYVGGRADLENRTIRAIGDPHARFSEDKLRLLRAVRMAARFDFDLEPATRAAACAMAAEITVVSGERISQELRKMLMHVRRARAMRLADELRLLPVILPELAPLLDEPGAPRWLLTLSLLERLEDPAFELALAALLTPAMTGVDGAAVFEYIGALGRRLRLSNRETDHTAWLVATLPSLADAEEWRLSQIKRLLAQPHSDDLLVLGRIAAECSGAPLAGVEALERAKSAYSPEEFNPPPLLTGNDLIAAGFQPGELFKRLLDQIRDAQLEGTITTRDAALDLARTHRKREIR